MMRVLNRLLFCYHKITAIVFKAHGKVLMMHHIGGNDTNSPYNLSVVSFEQLLNKIKSHNVIPIEKIRENKDFVVITFDDVPDDFYSNAFPLLVKYEIPFTIFISCSLLDSPGYISKEELRKIACCPLATIGSHGVSHIRFCGLNKAQKRNEYSSSKEILENLIGKRVDYFAFPYGSYTSCGLFYKRDLLDFYEYGFSTIPVALTACSWRQKYFLPRINVEKNNITKLVM